MSTKELQVIQVTSEDFEDFTFEVEGVKVSMPVPSQDVVNRLEAVPDPLTSSAADDAIVVIPEDNPLAIYDALETFKRENNLQELAPHDWSVFTISILRGLGTGSGFVNSTVKTWGLKSPGWFALNVITGGIGAGFAITGKRLYDRIKADPTSVTREDIDSYVKTYNVFKTLRNNGLEPMALFSLQFQMCLTMVNLIYGEEGVISMEWQSKLLCTLISVALVAPNMYMHYRSRNGEEAPRWARAGAEGIKGFSSLSSLNRILTILQQLNSAWLPLTWQGGLAVVGMASQLIPGPTFFVNSLKYLLTLSVDVGISTFTYDFLITIISLITNAIRNDHYYVDDGTMIGVGVLVGGLLLGIHGQRLYKAVSDCRSHSRAKDLAESMSRGGVLGNKAVDEHTLLLQESSSTIQREL